MLRARRALISVYNKQNLADFARGLVQLGVDILSTGGTYSALENEGIPVLRVADVTGFPEILGGRVKTLHPKIHGGILADRGRAKHLAELRDHGIDPIDIVVVNLYPFRETARTENASTEDVIEMIDIGGPCMVRAAAKNFRSVLVVVDPEDYPQVLAALEEGDGEIPEPLRRRLAVKAFRHTEAYDAAISEWLETKSSKDDEFPAHLLIDLEMEGELRYGENPHQQAALYRSLGGMGILGGYRQLQGKELSYNNLLDADAARRLVAGFTKEPTVAVIKHNNPCGVGHGDTLTEAYERAVACDPDSAFGSVVAVNGPVDEALSEAMASLFIEVVVAPKYDDNAIKKFAGKSRLRLIEAPLPEPAPGSWQLRAVDGGYLAQTIDWDTSAPDEWSCATTREPTPNEQKALELAWRVVGRVKSNAIVIANRDQTVGIGAGQMSRVDSCRIAVSKARLKTQGCVAASDAFFPFRDGLDVLADAGITAIIQPGGSRRDPEVIAAADERGIAMIFTSTRHFLH